MYTKILKTIKDNKPTSYPDPDNFEDYEDYEEAVESEKIAYMHYIANLLGYNSYQLMFKELEDSNIDDPEDELFDFFYDDMVSEDYYDSYDYSDDDIEDDYDNFDYIDSDYDY